MLCDEHYELWRSHVARYRLFRYKTIAVSEKVSTSLMFYFCYTVNFIVYVLLPTYSKYQYNDIDLIKNSLTTVHRTPTI